MAPHLFPLSHMFGGDKLDTISSSELLDAGVQSDKEDTDIQNEQNKRRKVGDSLKGSFETIASKKKELVEKSNVT